MKDWLKTTQAWWYHWHGSPISERLLSRLGIAVLDDAGDPLAFGYLYLGQYSEMAWLGFTVRSPFISPYKAGKALKLLIEATEDEVKRLGYSILYAGYDSPALQKLMERRGYIKAAMVREYLKELV